MKAMEKFVAAKGEANPPDDDGGDATFDAAIDELMAALKSGDRAAVGSALRAAVMECEHEE